MSHDPYPADVVARVAALCEAAPDRESCGVLLLEGGALRVVEVPNVADRYHAQDPAAFPRTSRDSYLMDAGAQLRLYRELAASGGAIAAVWHSHVEVGASFSAQDRAHALVAGLPAVPGADHLVLGLRAGKVTEVKRFTLRDGDFVERPV